MYVVAAGQGRPFNGHQEQAVWHSDEDVDCLAREIIPETRVIQRECMQAVVGCGVIVQSFALLQPYSAKLTQRYCTIG